MFVLSCYVQVEHEQVVRHLLIILLAIKKLMANEAWFWRTVLKIKWSDYLTNVEVYRRNEVLKTLKNRMGILIEHIKRQDGLIVKGL